MPQPAFEHKPVGNLAEKKTGDGMNAQHKNPCFSLIYLAYISKNKREGEN